MIYKTSIWSQNGDFASEAPSINTNSVSIKQQPPITPHFHFHFLLLNLKYSYNLHDRICTRHPKLNVKTLQFMNNQLTGHLTSNLCLSHSHKNSIIKLLQFLHLTQLSQVLKKKIYKQNKTTQLLNTYYLQLFNHIKNNSDPYHKKITKIT